MKVLSRLTLSTLLFVLTCPLPFSANALELKGVKVDETAQVGGNALVLSGAGVRTKAIFKVYVAGLYLAQKQTSADSVLSDTGNKRISMYFLRDLESSALLKGMNEGFTDNNNATEMAAIEPQMKQFRDMMTSAKQVKKDDLIVLDLTSAGTQVNINGKALGTVEGEAFNQALLKVWLGAKPVDSSLKKAMLGQ